jgi:transcription elongation factor Elf1
MQKGHLLEFNCLSCKEKVSFSVFNLNQNDSSISCPGCYKKYAFTDESLKRQLKKFEDLCSQLIESEEILGSAAIGIDVHEHHVKIPFKLLLTRLNSSLDLMIGNQPITINFRIEPLKDFPQQ